MGFEEEWKSRVVGMYRTSEVLDVKHAIHKEWSTVPIDFWGEIVKRINLDDNSTLLDVGCGTGELCDLVQSAFPKSKVFGLDIAGEVFSKIKMETDPSICYLVGDVENLCFPDESIDVLTAIHSFPYVRNLDVALSQIFTTVSGGGKFIVTANSLSSYPHVSKYREKIFSLYGWGEPVFPSTYFNLENMCGILSRYFPKVEVATLRGEMSVPVERFLPYFSANIDVWDRKVSPDERAQILSKVGEWIEKDAQNGMIIEPKYVGIATCNR